ncbi:MAG TPA: bifunctional phosphoribosyl-AMP cyclohydrolase/phosphoribosyl-ATP diphosphatase HisIE [Nitrospiraceae bacterium]|jgi:phosphoribosyl-ATP pyrophosphohydrolase/phosphoribosyl-AMP cyclohydrolase|nr:bifunctional phosphoribosyl-AMP cyclohydrolase/phosphoribosyl-ATP diphosphatase HisIE [Nitrospiraceae bacterium]
MTLPTITFDDQGLVPAVVQDWRDGSVLMVGFMNREALDQTLKTKYVHFWSRSRRMLWEKGKTSGHYLIVKDLFIDCDRDTVLVKAEPLGPTCHTGAVSCFFSKVDDNGTPAQGSSLESLGGIMEQVYRTIVDRKANPKPGSYVSSVYQAGQDRMLKKVVEEAGEVVLGSKNDVRAEIVHEVADLLFHTLVVLGYHGITLQEIYQELASRMGKAGLRQDKREGAAS